MEVLSIVDYIISVRFIQIKKTWKSWILWDIQI